MIPLVDLKKQYATIKDEINAAIQVVIDKTSFIGGENIKKLEHDFAKISGAKYGIAVSSGTTALHLALATLEIGAGDEVITVPNTFIATTEAIAQTGARIVFVDVDEKTFNIDISKIEKAITKKTKAIIPVHLYGQSCDIAPILQIAKKHNLKVMFDAAQAHLAEYDGQPIGKFGDCTCYSFFPGKNLGAYGDAGMVVANDEAFAKKMKMLSNHGRIDKYEHLLSGYNYRMDEIQAAILNVKLKYLPDWTAKRREIAKSFDEMLKGSSVITPTEDKKAKHVYHLYVIRTMMRDKLQKALNEAGVATGVHYPIPLHLQPAYKELGYKKGDFPVAEKLAEEILSLPIFPEMTKEEVEKVVELVSDTNSKRIGV